MDQRGAQRHGKASWKAILVERHGKAVMECVVESMTQAASRKRCHGKRHGNTEVRSVMECVMESDTGGVSWKSRHRMRHGNREACSVIERRHGTHHLLSITEKVSRKASWKQRGVQRHGKASWKAIPVERHGKPSQNASRKA